MDGQESHNDLIKETIDYLITMGFRDLKPVILSDGFRPLPDIIGFSADGKRVAIECGHLSNYKKEGSQYERIKKLLASFDMVIHIPYPRIRFGIPVYRCYIHESYKLDADCKVPVKVMEEERDAMKRKSDDLEKQLIASREKKYMLFKRVDELSSVVKALVSETYA